MVFTDGDSTDHTGEELQAQLVSPKKEKTKILNKIREQWVEVAKGIHEKTVNHSPMEGEIFITKELAHDDSQIYKMGCKTDTEKLLCTRGKYTECGKIKWSQEQDVSNLEVGWTSKIHTVRQEGDTINPQELKLMRAWLSAKSEPDAPKIAGTQGIAKHM